MLKQSDDFYEECLNTYDILKNIPEKNLKTLTQFKNWSFEDIIRHLHVWNIAAYKSLLGHNEWDKFNIELQTFFKKKLKLIDFEKYFTHNIYLKILFKLNK